LDLQWSDDSKRIIAVGEGKDKFGAVFLFDSGSSVGEISGHAKNIQSCDFKQTRPYRVITGGEDCMVNFYEGPPFKFKKSLKEHTRFVNCIRFSPDGNKFVTVGSDMKGFIFDAKEGTLITPLSETNAHTGGIYSVSWSGDSKQFLTASADKTCKIYNAENGECVKTFTFGDHTGVEHQMLGCLWQGGELISMSLEGYLYYLDINNPSQPKKVIRGHNKFITALAFDSTANTIYSASYDARVLAWNASNANAEEMVGKGHTNQITRMLIQGKNIITSALDDSVRITPIASKQYGESIALDSAPVDIAVSHKDQGLIFAVITDSIVVIKDGKVVNKHKTSFQPQAVALNPAENQLAVGGKDNSIHIYTVSGNNLSDGPVIQAAKGSVTRLAYSPDGKFLACSDQSREIVVIDTASNQVKIEGWVFHTARVNDIAWTPDSLHLASGSLDGALYIWSVQHPTSRIALKDSHRGGVNNVVWLDNNTLASSGQDCVIKTWNVTHH